MKKIYTIKTLSLAIALVILQLNASAENSSRSFWSKTTDISSPPAQCTWLPAHFETFSLQISAMKNFLASAPSETIVSARASSFTIDLPMPDGNFQSYTLVESPVMEPELAAAYPYIKTYSGQGIDDNTATIRLDVTQLGFHAYVLSANGTVYIDPMSLDNSADYIVYYKHDVPSALATHRCEVLTEEEKTELNADQFRLYQPSSTMAIGNQLRTYSLALAADGEYTTFYGGTVSGALAGMVTSINRVNSVYERELDIHLNLVANDTVLIFTNSATDPYTDANGNAMLGQNQTTVTNLIGSANYDIGHVFSTGGGGVAARGCVCTSTTKARGVTGLDVSFGGPIGDPFDIDFVVHEMGHQFGGNHTFNAVTGNCTNSTRAAVAAYEPGSGSTIMAYAGICAPNDLQLHSDPYFHTKSFDEIVTFSQLGIGNGCATVSSTGNSAPVLTIPTPVYNIPYMTPFKLTASATDPDSDPVTYCWEEYDLGPAGNWNAPVDTCPIFRSFNAVTSPTRLFPKLSNILANSVSIGEIKPSYARLMKFRCTARDNRSGGGGVIHSPTTTNLNAINTGTPFAITAPNVTGISWAGWSTQTVTWNVGGSDLAPISTPNVNIYMSTNNGTSFPITIATNVPNNGSHSFVVPNISTTQARIWVEGAGNVFFDINDKAFTIVAFVGINENNVSNNINVYPNPATNDVHFVINTSTAGKCRILLNDLAGRTVKEIDLVKNQSVLDQSIDLSAVANGMYILRFELPEGVAERKLVKE